QRHFPQAEIDWLDRADLRRQPLRVLSHALRHRYAAAVLVAPDLCQARLRLTSLVLSLPRTATRWRIDLRGNREAFDLGRHLAQNGLPMIRHLVACALAGLVGEPALRLILRLMQPRTVRLGRPRRILYLRSQLWLGLQGGGSVAHTAGVIGGLAQTGVEVQVVSSDRLPGVTAPTTLVTPETWFGGPQRDVEDLAYNVAFFGTALRTARRVRPDAIYQRHTTFNCGGALLSRVSGLALVLEFNSSELWKGRYWGGLHLVGAAELVEQINLRAADRVVVVSNVLRDQLITSGVPPEKIVVNPNGVDPHQFRADLAGTDVRRHLGIESAIVVGFSGTFGLWHGVPTLADVLARVAAARPQVHWLLMGDGPLRPLVDRAVEQHGLDDRVSLPGLVRHAEMPAYLAACDILVSPHGRQADGGEFFGSPTKLFEYMAAGRPIVASAVGQIAEALVDDHSALLVAPDDPSALCTAIVRLVDDTCLRVRLGQAARQAAEAHHTWRQNAQRVLASLEAS
ncbi:MAG: glycosyltransferase family 4 protein, partial [Chloroflexi bacterium]|nr:glycosyltransferase family 4 protein [Chloroflexota bacterium]